MSEKDSQTDYSDKQSDSLRNVSHTEELTASNNWETALSGMGFYIWEYDFKSRTIKYSHSCYKDLDIVDNGRARVPLSSCINLFHPEEKQHFADLYRGFFDNFSRPTLQPEHRLRHKLGHYIWVRAKLSVNYDDEGKPLTMMGLFEDISDSIEVRERARANSDRLNLALDVLGGAIWIYDIQEAVFRIDHRHQKILNIGKGSILTAVQWAELVHTDDLVNVMQVMQTVSRDNVQITVNYRLKNNDDDYLYVESLGRATKFDDDGAPLELTGVTYDRSQDVIAREQLRISEERLNLAFETANEGIWEFYPEENRVFRSQSFIHLLGYDKDPDPNSTVMFNVHPDDLDATNSALKAMTSGEISEISIQHRVIHKDGHIIDIESRSRVVERDKNGQALRIVGVVEDISKRVAQQKEIEALAFYDPLTNLPNRRLVLERANLALELGSRAKDSVTLMMLDLNKFKEINDTLGHDAGDQVLKTLSTRFLSCMRSMDTLGRQGGDEFIVVLPQCDKVQALIVARRILAKVKEPLFINGREINCGVSIGIASAPDSGSTIEELLQNADIAMYRAKQSIEDITWFNPEYARQLEKRVQLEQDLRSAIKDQSLTLNYQPRISLSSGEIMSVEALMRWKHPIHGFISPADFIGIAEEAGFISEIGHFLIREVCSQLCAWKEMGITTTVTINASPDELIDENYAKNLIKILAEHNLSHQCLEVEVTETAAISNWDHVINTLIDLDDADIIVSLDDWGTGYSSLSYLTQLPAHFVKIDRSFIENLHHSDPKKNTRLLLKGMISLTRSLGFELVAEGIETREQALLMEELGCLQGQGYLFSRPLTAGDITPLLKEKALLFSHSEETAFSY